MKLFRRTFLADELKLVFIAESYQDSREPPLFTGNYVRLNSGGPRLMVVDTTDNSVTVAWRDRDGVVHEHDFPPVCVHRIR